MISGRAMRLAFATAAALAGASAFDLCLSNHNQQCSNSDIDYIQGVYDHTTCCQKCQQKNGCTAWSWNYVHHHCHLHASCGNIVQNSQYHSGYNNGPTPSPGGHATITIFHWNAHWQCAQHAGGDSNCRHAAIQRFGEMAREVGAQIAVGIEINGASEALSGWSTSGEFQDAVSVSVAPGWRVLRKGGGQIQSGSGARGVAVMLVTPPFAVSGCANLCVLGVHPGHDRITGGKNIVDSVCGSAADRCAIASGDWNTGASQVSGGSWSSWSKLIGGHPTVLGPDSKTCCNHGTCCNFDHGGTNIQGASGSHKVWEYQLTSHFAMKEEHMPIASFINVPTSIILNSSFIEV